MLIARFERSTEVGAVVKARSGIATGDEAWIRLSFAFEEMFE